MATDIVVPTLGESVTEAIVAQWLKSVGDQVAADEPVVELETDKVTLEVNAPEAGVLTAISAEAGAEVEVGALLGSIGAGDGAAPAEKKAAPAEKAPKQEAESEAPAPAEAPAASGETVDVAVPALGESVTEATVAQWLKQPGEAVSADEPIVELETDKVTLEVNAPADGAISEIKAESGATVSVGDALASFAKGAGGTKPAAKAEAPKETAPKETAAADVPAAPSAPQATAERSYDPAGVRRGADGKISKDELLEFLAGAPLPPSVKKLVEEHKLDPSQIPASGKDGRLTKEDVLAFLERPQPQAAAPASAPAAAKPAAAGPAEERVKMTKLRQTIARRLKEAQNTAAILTTFNEADMGAVMALRSEYKEGFEKKHGIKLGFTSFFAKAVVRALQELPAVNARIDGDEIVYNKAYNIGMAVSTPNGLMVPVIRDCDKKGFAEIEADLASLAKRGRDGKLGLDEMSGGTFTITNGGVFGSLLSTPILNMPQSAILGLHKIQERPMAVNGKVEVRPMMYLALSYDHRIIDGREAVTFLVRVKEGIEDPRRLLLDV